MLVTHQKPCSPLSCELAFVGQSTGVVWGLPSPPVASVGGKCSGEEWKGSLKDGCKVFSGLEFVLLKGVLSAASTSRLSFVFLVPSVT